MKSTLIKMATGLGLMVLAAQQLYAQPRQCAPRDDLIQQLEERYGETRRGIGIARQGAVMELFASANTGSWTITITLPDGMTCLVASGQAFEALADALPPNA
ncbi:hypothetical protein SAMN05444358_103130 [Ruegeria halocynthiae]|uniref:Uncharacterized protein n=1 Tax=Ruegeria halocynthiae TaxID=985054 RepID=A0A1H2Z8N9_9RHOB|nr:hypothetical protein [Ruegeria halocynthiae]SDX13711.1 hypothetical protein SAMN05444358_103130 [Ruegeria halocynthiae]